MCNSCNCEKEKEECDEEDEDFSITEVDMVE